MAKMKARVENYRPTTVEGIRTSTRARLPCGCCVYVGLDSHRRATTGAKPCSPEHELLTDRFSGLMRERQRNQGPRRGALLVNVCAELLTQAAKEML